MQHEILSLPSNVETPSIDKCQGIDVNSCSLNDELVSHMSFMELLCGDESMDMMNVLRMMESCVENGLRASTTPSTSRTFEEENLVRKEDIQDKVKDVCTLGTSRTLLCDHVNDKHKVPPLKGQKDKGKLVWLPRGACESKAKKMEVGSSSAGKGKNICIDEKPATNSCGVCEFSGAPQMKACLKFLKSQGSHDKKERVDDPNKKMNEQFKKVWLPCGLLSLMKVLRCNNCKVDGKVVKPLTNDVLLRRRRFGKRWSKVT